MRRQRALPLKITLSLIAGAFTTWTAAWSCALWAEVPTISWDVEAPLTPWPRGVPDYWPAPNRAWSQRTACRTVHRWTVRTPAQEGSPIRELFPTAVVHEFGWPFRALAFTEADIDGPTLNRIDPADVPAWTSPGNSFEGLPLRILPARFTLNTLVYAAALLATFELLSLARRRLRARRNHCPTCNYNRSGLPLHAACPECGRAHI